MTASAARKASGVLKQGGVILTLQNGIGNLEIIETEIGVGRTIVGVTSHGGTLLGPGRVRHAGKGMTHIARSLALSRQVDILAAVFQKAEIEVRVEENIESLIWSKLVINAGINALAAILRIPNGILESDEACKRIMFQAVSEAAAVARGLGIQLPYDPQDHVQRVCRLTAGNRASMLQDILRGTKTEINAINEVIVKKGEKLGIPTPCNRFLSEIIKALEATSTHRII
jgi:2-dehydropantoate 2-reductase